MTAIAYRAGVMAADTASWVENNITIKCPPKLVRVHPSRGGGVAASCGLASDCYVFREHMASDMDAWMIEVDGKPGQPPHILDKCFEALWVKDDLTIWKADEIVRFYPVSHPFIAIGAPTTYMMGALAAGATAVEAVALACQNTDGADGEVQIEWVGALR